MELRLSGPEIKNSDTASPYHDEERFGLAVRLATALPGVRVVGVD